MPRQVQVERQHLALHGRMRRGREEAAQAQVRHRQPGAVQHAPDAVHEEAVAGLHGALGKWVSTQARTSASTPASLAPDAVCAGWREGRPCADRTYTLALTSPPSR